MQQNVAEGHKGVWHTGLTTSWWVQALPSDQLSAPACSGTASVGDGVPRKRACFFLEMAHVHTQGHAQGHTVGVEQWALGDADGQKVTWATFLTAGQDGSPCLWQEGALVHSRSSVLLAL